MKNNIICTMIFIFTVSIVMAQEEQSNLIESKFDYWNFGFSVGFTGNIYSRNLKDMDKPGVNYNIDISLTPKKNIGIFINYASSSLSGKYYDYLNSTFSRKLDVNYSQFTVGPRFYSNSKNSFLDGGLGYFKINNDDVVGLTLGLGGKVKVSDIYALSITGRINAADFLANPYFFYSLSAGFEINNKTDKQQLQKSENRFSIGAFAGSFGESFNGSGNTSFSGELTYSVGKQTALLINYIYSHSEIGYYNNNGYYYLYSKDWQNELTGGVRLYMKGNALRLFVEGMTGYYSLSTEYPGDRNFNTDHYTIAENYFGITFGGGIEFRLIDDLSGLIKTDISNYIEEGSYIGLFGGLKYTL